MSKRGDYVKELQKYVNVTIYGGCGNMDDQCPRSNKCLDNAMRKHKFYLALENSICEEYITEKMQRALDVHAVVPIVMGAGPYDRYFPPGSYISVFDFRSAKDLGDYIHYLDKNPVSKQGYSIVCIDIFTSFIPICIYRRST